MSDHNVACEEQQKIVSNHLSERTLLDIFLTGFIGALASDSLTSEGNLISYLTKPDTDRSGDEANFVDLKITQSLIAQLGYVSSEVTYNKQDKNLRADFIVKINEYPDRACFIVEDKSTTNIRLASHRAQLQSYMGQYKAPRGLLCNGLSILAYDQTEGSIQTPVLEISIKDAVSLWRGEHLAAQGKIGLPALEIAGVTPIFSALWRRFRRESFARLTKLIDDLTLQSENGGNYPHSASGKTWIQSLCRLPLIPVDEHNASMLTNSLKGLIAEIEDDANAQLSVVEYDYAEYLGYASHLPNETTTTKQRENGLILDVMALMSSADDELKKSASEIVRGVIQNEIPKRQLEIIKKWLYGFHPIAKQGNDKDPIHNLCHRIEKFSIARARNLEVLKSRYSETIRVIDWFSSWKAQTADLVFQSDEGGELRREFLTQTSYLIVIRILLVRIMEDKKLVKRMFTNGGVALWFRQVEPHYLSLAMGRSPEFLLEMAYTSAQHIYAHFYAEKTVLDWYQPDRNAVVRVLHVLAGFDLRRINRDIIGTVYNQYVEAKHKHESGLYYTPPEVVSYMLDRIGYKGTGIIGKRLIDLSCGSGGFLVEAAHRLADAYKQYYKAQGYSNVPPEKVQSVLNEIRGSLHGIDLNPFACSLAETNLLIQVIDFFSIAFDKSEQASIDQFHIYCSDSMTFSDATLGHLDDSLPYPTDELPIADCIKAGIGEWADKFDFVVGNPPYVRADEGAGGLKEFRERVKRDYPVPFVRDVLTMKWDLFIAFVAASHALLRKKSDYYEAGKAAILTSNAIETVPYAESLRLHLVQNTSLDEIHFLEGVKLFEDAAVFNTITIFSNEIPSPQHHVARYWHEETPKWGSHGKTKSQSLRQSNYSVDVFRQKLPSIQLMDGVRIVPLTDVFYISVGMVLNANEKNNKGAFAMDELIFEVADDLHCAPFAGSKEVDYFGVSKVKYLEYGTGTRVPSQIRRPTFPELYDRPKLMVAEFGGFAYDDGTWDDAGFLKCNHSVFILMPWVGLSGVTNKSIVNQLGKNEPQRAAFEAMSAKFDLWYVLAYLNSNQMRKMLNGVARSAIAGRLQPDDLRQISIPMPDNADLVARVASLAKEAAGIQKQLLPLRRSGWRINDNHVFAPAIIPSGVPTLPISSALAKWGMQIKNESAKANSLFREQIRLFSGKREVLIAPLSVGENAVEWLRRQFSELPDGMTMGEAERQGVLVPMTPLVASNALIKLETDENNIKILVKRISIIQNKISDELAVLFDEIKHPPIR
jgi:type I restriction enzyme M protein